MTPSEHIDEMISSLEKSIYRMQKDMMNAVQHPKDSPLYLWYLQKQLAASTAIFMKKGTVEDLKTLKTKIQNND